ncbi:putative T7SS-secreted protein [Streptomyces sp. NPDC046261]|uniref:putative T7SS-secreted protein n=1 Tax=Streptomyces sp. NPDC046261 TaxID=3157200 RepID=UPI0033DBF68E
MSGPWDLAEKGFNKGGELVEKGIDETKKAAGKVVDKGTDLAADGLDAAGAHGTARKVERWGDETASGLGAHVSEHQLGQSEDPKELVHGDVGKIEATVTHLRNFHASFNTTHDALKQVRATGWKGQGADAFTAAFVEQPKKWAQAADAFEAAAGALESYAHTVTWAQTQAMEAIQLWKKGEDANRKAVDDYNAKAIAYNLKLERAQDPGPRPEKPGEPGKADMEEAQRLLTEARRQRDAAADEAKARIDGAVADAPQKPTFTDRMKAETVDLVAGEIVEGMHYAGGGVRSLTDAVKFVRGVNPFDIHNITHPAEYAGHLSDTAAGVLSLASHPERLPGTLLGEGWGKDSSEAEGRLTGNAAMAVMTGGGSAAGAAGSRVGIAGAKGVAQEAAGATALRSGRAVAGSEARATAQEAVESGTRTTGRETAEAEARATQEAAESGTRTTGREPAEGEGHAAPQGAPKAGQDAATETGAESGAARAHAEENPHASAQSDVQKTNGQSDPIDLSTGYMYLPQTDVSLPAALPLVFSRRVQSGYRAGRWLGLSWASTADQRLEIDSQGVVFVCEDGKLLRYPHPAPGVPTLPSNGPRWPMDRTDDGYTVTDPDSGRTSYFALYGDGDELALLEQITDRNGHWITFEYEAGGIPIAIAHSAGYRIRITTESGRITALHLAGAGPDGSDAELIRYGYTDGNLTDVINSSGEPLRFGYDDRRRVTSWTDRNGSHYVYEYDDRDRCVFETGAEGHMAARIEYGEPDPQSGLRTTTLTNALGHTTRHVFNDALQLVAEIDPSGAVTRMEWDRHDRLLAHTDPLGRTTRYRYDADGRLTAVVRPDGREATASYTAIGRPETVTNPDGTVWRHTYDAAGNRTSTTDPTGAVTRFTYDDAGHPTSVTDAQGNTTRIRCDRAGLPIEATDPLGGVTTYRRDAFGRVTTVIDPLGAMTRMQWSVEGRLVRRIEPDGASQSWTYDGEGNCVTHTDAVGGVTTYEYTHFDKLRARTGPDGVRYEFEHDALLQLTGVTNPQGLTWSYTYDPAGHLAAETDFDGRTLTYAHDAAGQLTARTNGLGQTITYEHDVLGRVVAKDAAGAVTTYAHDAAGRLLEAVGPDATLVYSRDRLGRVKSETTNGRTLTFAYDELGRRRRRVTPGGAVSTWTYDAGGRRASLTASGRRFDIEHDAVGREIARHFGEGVTLSHAWDVTGRLRSQSVTLAGGEPVQRRDYTYRRDGYLSGVDDRTFELDAVGRVTAVDAPGWQERYAYDEAGNQTEATWPPGHPGGEAQGRREYAGTRIVRAGGVRYEHDAQGRVVLRQKTRLSRKPDTWRYEWDAEDRLTAVVTPDGTRWRYLYDPLGRRIAKQRLCGTTGEVAEQVDFTWDGPTLTEQTTTSRDLPNPVTLTWDYDGLRPVSQTERISAADASQGEIDSRFFAIVTDLVGTPSELVDETGTVAWRTRATLWGTTAWPARSTTYTPLRFPGQYFDPETGLHYNFHRYYDPETGRYASQDPLGLAPAPNPVAYVHNVHTWADPIGLAPYNKDFESRKEAFNQAKDWAGIPRSQQPTRQWIVGGDPTLRHRVSNYVYDGSPGAHGRYYQYETPQGTRVIANHTNDPEAPNPHFHVGQPKGGGGHGVDMMGQRYQQVGEKHHFYYPGD